MTTLSFPDWLRTIKAPEPTDPGAEPHRPEEFVRQPDNTGWYEWHQAKRTWEASEEGKAWAEWKTAHDHYTFCKSWGYEQWLIKTYQKDIEQLSILMGSDYDNYRMACEIKEHGSVEAYLQTRQLVVATQSIYPFLQQRVAKGWVGVWMTGSYDNPLCMFPILRGPGFFGSFSKIRGTTQVEHHWRGDRNPDVQALCDPKTGAPILYTSLKDVWERSEHRAINNMNQAIGKWCFIINPDLGPQPDDKRWFVVAESQTGGHAGSGMDTVMLSNRQVKLASTPTDQRSRVRKGPLWRGKNNDIYVPPIWFYKSDPVPEGFIILDVHIDQVLIDEPRIPWQKPQEEGTNV